MEKNYKLEGNIDFYAELYKSLDEPDSDEEANNNNKPNENGSNTNKNVCLITNQKLEEKYVKMGCGHTFNYLPLYNDILNHKTKFNNMESTSNRLKSDEIRCPYCRYKQQGLLPYYPDLGLKEIYGVNSYNPAYIINASNHVCSYPDCQRLGYRVFMNKRYCSPHAWKVKQEYLLKKKEEKEVKLKEKEELKQKKLEEKQKKLEEKQKKLEEKQKLKEQKEKIVKPKVIKKKILIENTIIDENLIVLTDDSEILNSNFCKVIMKTGARKGQQCSLEIHSDNMCKRHFNLANKIIINDK